MLTVRSAAAAVPLKETGPAAKGAAVVFVIAPGVELVTFICTWQLAPVASEDAVKRTLASPTAEAPPLVLVTVPQLAGVKVKLVFCSVRPVGKLSSTETVVRALGLAPGLANVRIRVVVLPAVIEAAPNVLVTAGGM